MKYFSRTTASVLLACHWLCSPDVFAAGGHEQITGPFIDAQAVTLQCLGCHAQQGEDILRSSHWTWQRHRIINNTEQVYSKKDGLTTFAITASTNPEQCMNCHISINRQPLHVAPGSPVHVDCLVCHDTTGTYRRDNGSPAVGLDLPHIARHVGRPSPANCSSCHSGRCGLPGSNSHGNLEPDVHFTASGGSLTCQDCHSSAGSHAFSRQLTSGVNSQRTTACATCHGYTCHRQPQLNRHAEVIDCRTCHIPTYAAVNPSVVNWNWLSKEMGDLSRHSNGAMEAVLDTSGLIVATDLVPQYLWDDGGETLYQRGDKIDPGRPVLLLGPTKRTLHAKIAPFTISYGTQPYDTKYRYLISPKLTDKKGEYFMDNWEDAARTGMQGLRLPFSGDYAFTTTITYQPITHGVRPAAEALDCMACHGAASRMNWKRLGYEADPWATSEPPPPASRNTEERQPANIEETVLPEGFSGG